MKNKLIIIDVLLLGFFLILTYLIMNGYIYKFDDIVYDLVVAGKNNILSELVKLYTHLGGPIGLAIFCLFACYIFRKTLFKFLIPLNLILSFILNFLLKNIVCRPRPVGINLVNESGFSFPSGHTMVSTVFYGYLAYLICKKTEKKFHWIVYSICSLIILTIGISRIYLGVHFASDVLGGLVIGAFFLINFIAITKK